MKLKVNKPFEWAHQGVRIEAFEKGQTIETDDEDLIRVSLEEKWTSRATGASQTQAPIAAPEAEAGVGAATGTGESGNAAE